MSRTPNTSRPGSRAGSRVSSRENSSNEIKRIRSTSDYGSEVGDAENQDPNFRWASFSLLFQNCSAIHKYLSQET